MSAVADAERNQLRHAADKDGWCAFHLRHFNLQVPAGSCSAFLSAAEFISARRREQALRRLRVVFRPPGRT